MKNVSITALKAKLKNPNEIKREEAFNIYYSLIALTNKTKFGGQNSKIRVFFKEEQIKSTYNPYTRESKEYKEIEVVEFAYTSRHTNVERVIKYLSEKKDGIIKVEENKKGVIVIDYFVSNEKDLIDLREKKEEVKEIKEIQKIKEVKKVASGAEEENLRNVIFNFEKEEGKTIKVSVWRGKKGLFKDEVKVADLEALKAGVKANFRVYKDFYKSQTNELVIQLAF